ncbi:hypothetical protein Ahia01_000260000 [Argonauta hians]
MEQFRRRLPACMLPRTGDYLPDSDTYNQALSWVQEKQLVLKIFLDLLKIYPKLIQEKAYDSLWNFILPLIPTSDSDLSQLDTNSFTHGQISCSATSSESPLCDESFLPSPDQQIKVKENKSLQPADVKVPNILKQNNLFQKKKKGLKISKTSSKYVPCVATTPYLLNSKFSVEENAYINKVFVCRDPNNIKDIMSCAVLSSVSTVTFVHCMVPTLKSANSIITQCNVFIFIFSEVTVSSIECLLQLKQALDNHLPIIFVRYPDFQLPCNMVEIITKFCESMGNLNKYFSDRRRSFVISNPIKKQGHLSDFSCLDRMTSTSPLLNHSKSNKNPRLKTSNKKPEILPKMIQTLMNALNNGYEQSHLYSYKVHVRCISHILGSISDILKRPISYNSEYFKQSKKNTTFNSKTVSLTKIEIENIKNFLTEKKSNKYGKHIKIPQVVAANSKTKQLGFQENNETSSSSSASLESDKNNTSIHSCKFNKFRFNSWDDRFPGKETSFIVFPKNSSQSNQKPVVVKWPPHHKELQLMQDEIESQISFDLVDLDLTNPFNPCSDED